MADMVKTRECPYPGCKTLKPSNQYACKVHWYSLPKKIRDDIWYGYKRSSSKWLDADFAAKQFWGTSV